MENTTTHKTHPLVLVAATAVTVASLAGIGAIFGLIPGKSADAPAPVPAVVGTTNSTAPASPAAAPPATAPVAMAPAPAAPPAVVASKAETTAPAPRQVKAAPRPSRPVEREPRPIDEGYRVSHDDSAPIRTSPRPVAVCRDCGVIASVREIAKEGDPSGVGAVAGGVLGGVVGNQMGKGRGRDAMTVIGAVGGAVAGHQIEKSQRASREYQITIRFDDGTTQVITQSTEPTWRNGDRVRVSGGQIVSSL